MYFFQVTLEFHLLSSEKLNMDGVQRSMRNAITAHWGMLGLILVANQLKTPWHHPWHHGCLGPRVVVG